VGFIDGLTIGFLVGFVVGCVVTLCIVYQGVEGW